MTEATIRIPDSIDIKKISDEIVYKALAIAIEKKKKEILREMKRVERKINGLEKKHNMNLDEFEKTLGDSFQEHDEWMDWSFLVENRNQLIEEIRTFEHA